jgi:hypothetical protein
MTTPIKKTFTFIPLPDVANVLKEYQTILQAQGGLGCDECDEDAESVLLVFYDVKGTSMFGAHTLCKEHMEHRLEITNRARECTDSGATPDNIGHCMSKKEKDEAYWKHQGKADLGAE